MKESIPLNIASNKYINILKKIYVFPRRVEVLNYSNAVD